MLILAVKLSIKELLLVIKRSIYSELFIVLKIYDTKMTASIQNFIQGSIELLKKILVLILFIKIFTTIDVCLAKLL